MISKPEFIKIRNVFPHEALNFTVWLEQNIDALSERIGIKLTVVEREKSVGSFNVDLLCTDGLGDAVIIENQLEQTDHDHLGKLLTYMINLDAKTAIWIATDVRQEHQRVIDRLNEATGEDMAFYFVKVEALKATDDLYIPIFTVLTRPDEQTREIGREKKELAERETDVQRELFWTQLIEKAHNTRFGRISPSRTSYVATGSGKTGVRFRYVVYNTQALVDLYIDFDHSESGEKNKLIFDELHAKRAEIEQDFGQSMDWRRLDDFRASRIVYMLEGRGLNTPSQWDELQVDMIEIMRRFDTALRKHIQNLSI